MKILCVQKSSLLNLTDGSEARLNQPRQAVVQFGI